MCSGNISSKADVAYIAMRLQYIHLYFFTAFNIVLAGCRDCHYRNRYTHCHYYAIPAVFRRLWEKGAVQRIRITNLS